MAEAGEQARLRGRCVPIRSLDARGGDGFAAFGTDARRSDGVLAAWTEAAGQAAAERSLRCSDCDEPDSSGTRAVEGSIEETSEPDWD